MKRTLTVLIAGALAGVLVSTPASASSSLSFYTSVTIPCSGTAYQVVRYTFSKPVDVAFAVAYPFVSKTGDVSPIVSPGHPARKFTFRIKLTRPHWPAGFYTARVLGFAGRAGNKAVEHDSQNFGFIVQYDSCWQVA